MTEPLFVEFELRVDEALMPTEQRMRYRARGSFPPDAPGVQDLALWIETPSAWKPVPHVPFSLKLMAVEMLRRGGVSKNKLAPPRDQLAEAARVLQKAARTHSASNPYSFEAVDSAVRIAQVAEWLEAMAEEKSK